MAETEDAMKARRADRIEVRAEPEHLRSFVGRQGVVEHEPERLALGDEAQNQPQERPAPFVGIPCAAREEAVKPLVVDPPADAGSDQRLRHRVPPRRPHPSDH
jgi:hypothetical protein